jgi:hypothetical protein
MLDFKSICALASCNRRLKGDAESRFALATQHPFTLTSYEKTPDKIAGTHGLFQYHPDLQILGFLKSLKMFPYLVLCNVTRLLIPSLSGISEGLEEMFLTSRRLCEFNLVGGELEDGLASRLFGVLSERERIGGVSGLKIFRFSFSKIENEVMIELATYIANTSSLKKLELAHCTFGDNLHILADGLVRNRSISDLDFFGSSFSLDSELPLSKILRGCPFLLNLTMFSISSQIESQQLETITAAILDDNCNLRYLGIGGNRLSDANVIALAPAIVKLCKLDVSKNYNISNTGQRALGEAIKISNTIIHINLNSCLVGTGFLEIFSGLAVNKSMQILELSNCKIDTQKLHNLKTALVGKTELKELRLSNNNIDDSGCQHVAEILARCPYLEFLHLGNNSIGSVGVKAIAAVLPQAIHLQRLILGGSKIVDDASASALFTTAHDHPSLFRISISIADGDDGFHIGELAKHQLRNLKHDLVKNY